MELVDDVSRLIFASLAEIHQIYRALLTCKKAALWALDEDFWKLCFKLLYRPPRLEAAERYITNRETFKWNGYNLTENFATPAVWAAFQSPSKLSWRDCALNMDDSKKVFSAGYIGGGAFTRYPAEVRLVCLWDQAQPDLKPRFVFELIGYARAMGGSFSGQFICGVWKRISFSSKTNQERFELKPFFERIASGTSIDVKVLLDSASSLSLNRLKNPVEREFDEEIQELIDDGIFHVSNPQNGYILEKKNWEFFKSWNADMDPSKRIGLNRVLDQNDEDDDE